MSVLGSYKAQITKAAKALRKKISEVDEATLEPLDPTSEAGKDPQFILSRKSSLYLLFTSFGRTIAHLRAQREKAEEYARQHPDEQGEYLFLQQIHEHWDAGQMDELMEEAETLHDRIDAAIKLLPSSETLYSFRASVVPSLSGNSSPRHTQDPNSTRQLTHGTGLEIRSQPLPQEQQRLADGDADAPADYRNPSTRYSSAAQGFSIPVQDPSYPPTFANPPVSSTSQLNPFLSFPPMPNTTSFPTPVEQSLKLPTFEIPTFHGDVDRFFEFWDLFSVAVHNNTNVPIALKFMYLKSHLRGPAANIIAGFQSTAENYEDAVRTLTNTYGRPEILRNRLWDKLMQLTPASESSLSQRATLCAIKAIWAQLKHLKEDSSAIGTLKIIRTKFPRRTREKIGESKRKGDSMWTVDELLETLDSIIDRLENVEDADPSDYHSYNSQAAIRQYSPSPRGYPRQSRNDYAFTRYRSPSYYPRRPSIPRSPSPYSRQNRPPTPYYPRRASRSPSAPRRRAPFSCAFCNDPHLSERCKDLPDIASRRGAIIRWGLCWVCLQRGHVSAQCRAPPCSFCGRMHHKALCPTYLRSPRTPIPSARQTYTSPQRSTSPRRVQFDRDNYQQPSYARSPSRRYYSKSVSPVRRQSASPSKRASSARRSRSPALAVHSATCTSHSSDTAMFDTQPTLFDHHQASVGAHSPSSCTTVCSKKSIQQEPRLMVVHAITRNTRTELDELLTVFLDSGSQYSFICTSLAKHLGLSFRNTRTFTTLTFGGHQFTEESSEVTLVLWDQHDYPIRLQLWTRETITTVPRTNTQNDTDIVNLEDRVEVDVLIGIDNYWRIVDLHKNEKLPSGLILSQTRFGPVLSGLKRLSVTNSLSTISTLFTGDEAKGEQLVRSLLGLDLLGTDEGEETEDAIVIKHFYDTVKTLEGKIYVSFPWKPDHPPLADNKALAFRRLQSQYEKLSVTPAVWKDYCRQFDEQLRKGIIEDVTREPVQGSNVYYIPHQAVFKQESLTTKMRIVFDASSHQKDCLSLNDCLYQGPSLLPDLVGTLMRSRLHRYLIIADVEKAFHQIHLHLDQRDATRFLWLKNVHEPPSAENLRILRFTRVPFGINASPFLLNMSIRYFLEQDQANRLKEEILTNTYVDNVIVGATSVPECFDKIRECKDIFSRMNMNLRQFMSNCHAALLSIPETDCMILQGRYVNLLGIKWNPTLDVLSIPVNIARQVVTTKRTALQAYASTFDPLGLLTPLMIKPKMFIQDLWEAGYGWDDIITDEDVQKWNMIVQDVSGFHAQVPRFIFYPQRDRYDLVVCSDASKRVYTAVIYILAHGATTKSSLLFAKAKLAPPGAITIPRMELLACHMAAKMARFVESQLKVRFQSIRFLTDSQIVLYWIQTRKPLKTYVANRVRYIHRILDELQAEKIETGFYYLASEDNPADCATRGLSAADFQQHMWWTGPTFFRKPFRDWPCKSFEPSTGAPAGAEVEELQISKAVVTSVTTMLQNYKSFVTFTRTNSYAKLVRITAYALKFLAKLRVRVLSRHGSPQQDEHPLLSMVGTTLTITPDDFTAAELVLTREHYRESQQQLNGSQVQKLSLRHDTDGTIRVNLRMANAQNRVYQDPILILSAHPLCQMLIQHYHLQLFHAGPSHLITALRERFFIPGLKRAVKSCISRCVTCKRYQGRLCAYPHPPDLPVQRVTKSRPFQHIGLDYFGPILVRLQSGSRHKVWICLFTCMATRALHLEVVRDNSTFQFLLAFRRFMARRGTPDSVTSDNAPTFKLGQEIIVNELPKVAHDTQTSQFLTSNDIQWTFITPYSPWKGGFYERLVGSVKIALKKAIRNQLLDIWLLETLIVEIEAILNTRPLFPVNSENSSTSMAIRPIDLITPNFRIARLTGNMPQKIERTTSDNYHALQTYYRSLQADLDSFWNVWQNEYLAALAEREAKRVKHQTGRRTVRAGDIVLVKQDAPRSTWPLGLILELHTSQDGQIRSARIKTGKRRVLDRSINQLLPLEIAAENYDPPTRAFQGHLALMDNLQGTSKA